MQPWLHTLRFRRKLWRRAKHWRDQKHNWPVLLFWREAFPDHRRRTFAESRFYRYSGICRKKRAEDKFCKQCYSIDEDKAKSISKANVSLIQISIDGTEDIHNSIRKNPESFERALNTIRLLKKHSGAKITVSTIVMPQNIDSLPELKAILKSVKISFWNIGTVMPSGKLKIISHCSCLESNTGIYYNS